MLALQKTARVGVAIGAAVVFASVAGVAQAQTGSLPRRAFVGASLAGNRDGTLSSGWTDAGGSVTAAGATIGVDFSRRWSVQVEGELPAGERIATYGYQYGTTRSSTEIRYRNPTVGVLFGFHPAPGRRVDVAFLFGPAWRNEIETSRTTYSQTVNGAPVTEHYENIVNHWEAVPTLGLDAAIRMTSRVDVVTQLRVHLVNVSLIDEVETRYITRPAVGIRFRF
jgi:hypothetical protein